MKKNLLVMTIAFIGATILFCGVSLLFGETLMSTFLRATDAWLGIVAYMVVVSVVVRIANKLEFTKTYIAMIALFLANFVLFFYASSTPSQTGAVVGLSTSLGCGLLGIALPFITDAIKNHRGDSDNGSRGVDTDAMQKEWQKLRAHVLKMDKAKRVATLKEKLAFRLVGDSLYGSLDLARGMVTVDDTAMTFSAGLKNSVNPLVLEEAEQYIESLC